MNRKSIVTNAALLATLVLLALPARPAAAQAAQSQEQKPTYTIPEYNAFQACSAMSQKKEFQGAVKCLDDFVAKFPSSTLTPYVYQLYFPAYAQLKDYAKTMEYADKVIALGDKVDAAVRLQAIQTRCQVFPTAFNPKAPDAHDQLVKERDAALEGAKLLAAYPKPANSTMTDQQFADQKKPGLAFFQSSAGFADLQLKDFPAAISAYKDAISNNPNDAVSYYRLGVAYLSSAPATPSPAPGAATTSPTGAASNTAAPPNPTAAAPNAATPTSAPGSEQKLDGFWNLARAINLKIPGDAQVRTYLKQQILAYEQPGCDTLADAQLSELLQLAGTSGDRPATYTIPSQADLDKIRQSSNILSVISDLSAGGDKAKMTWLAICSAQFPEVVGKIIDVKPGDGFVDFMVYTGATQDDMEKATAANMDVKVWTTGTPPAAAAPVAGAAPNAPAAAQPDVVRLQKDDGIRFSGTVLSYDPTPFLLHWDQVKVDPTVIPEKQEQGKHHRVPPKKSPGKK